MSRIIHRANISLTLALLGVLTLSHANAQTVRSYCLTGINGELGHCDYYTFEACRVAGAGYGICVASEQPVSGASVATTAAAPVAKRRR
jgi:hypothetical protein